MKSLSKFAGIAATSLYLVAICPAMAQTGTTPQSGTSQAGSDGTSTDRTGTGGTSAITSSRNGGTDTGAGGYNNSGTSTDSSTESEQTTPNRNFWWMGLLGLLGLAGLRGKGTRTTQAQRSDSAAYRGTN